MQECHECSARVGGDNGLIFVNRVCQYDGLYDTLSQYHYDWIRDHDLAKEGEPIEAASKYLPMKKTDPFAILMYQRLKKLHKTWLPVVGPLF